MGQLFTDVAEWGAAGHVEVDLITREDLLGADVVLLCDEQPPLLDWSLRLSEVVHHLRGALDSMTYELAGINNPSNSARESVLWPVAKSQAEWDSIVEKRNLEVIPSEYLDRIRRAQAFTKTKTNDADPYQTLAALSNHDKHRGMIETAPQLDGITGALRLSRAGDKSPGVDGSLKVTSGEFSLTSGTVLISYSWDIPMTVDLGQSNQIVPFRWVVKVARTGAVMELEALRAMFLAVVQVMTWTCTGKGNFQPGT